MNLNRKVVEGSIVAGMLVVMTTTTSVTSQVVSNESTNTVSDTIAMTGDVNRTVSAGVVAQLGHNEEVSALSYDVNIEQSGVEVVASANAGVMGVMAQNMVSVDAADAAQPEIAGNPQTEVPEETAEVTDTIAAEQPAAGVQDAAGTDVQDAVSADVQNAVSMDVQDAAEAEAQDAVNAELLAEASEENVSSEADVTENVVNEIQSDAVSSQMDQEEAEWANRLMPDVNEYLNIRSAGDENAEIVGKLYKGDAAEIVEQGDTWTHITSGSVDGYVLNDYCVFGADAYTLAQQECETEAKVMTGGLRLRTEPNEQASVIDAVYEGQTLTVNTEVPDTQGWLAVEYNNQTVYVCADYVEVDIAVGDAISIEEERAAAAAAAAEAEKANQNAAAATQKEAVAASADDVTLLGALIQLEAGSECYEGKVAVGAVVMNRVRSGSYPNSISGVIYQGGQFTTASSIAGVIAGGVNASCMQAAQEAINGADNTGGCVSFRRASAGYSGIVIGNHVFF